MITNAASGAAADVQSQQFLTLIELSKAIASHRKLSDLFHDLACRLSNFFEFRDLGVMLYDDKQNVMRSHILEACEPALWEAPSAVPIEGSITGWVWQNQQPMIIHDLDQDTRFPIAKVLRDHAVKSVCSLPMSTVHQRLGTLNLWSDKPGAYDQLDLHFAQLVASQIAVALEAQCHQQQLARERDRWQLLLEINNTLVSNLNLRELLSAISHCLSTVVPHDAAALALFDAESNQLRLTALDFPAHEEPCAAGEIIPLEGTPAGTAFTSHEPVISNYCQSEDAAAVRALSSGLKSGCTAPLLLGDRVLGVLGIKSVRENAFSEEDAELLAQVAKQVAIAVENALAYQQIEALKNKLEGEKLYLEEEIQNEYNFEEIVGKSAALKRALQDVETVAATDSNVLIYGETGTGKELIAHAIHNLSPRRERTLVKVNCAAIPTGLLESELFGHEKGAFTGAIERRIGRFETAHQGTIFLDEVEDIPLELQSKLLRVLQEKEFERLGSSRTIRVDVRLVAATNANLAQLVAEKKFRSDLFYRLNVFPINLPPLRERREDIPLLVQSFAQKFAQQMKKGIEEIPREAMTALTSYHWPGNIRELQNLIERGVILSRGRTLDLPLTELKQSSKVPSGNHDGAATQSDGDSLEAIEREHILRVLRDSSWVIGGPTGAAARLGINRTTLNNRLRKLGITRPQPQ